MRRWLHRLIGVSLVALLCSSIEPSLVVVRAALPATDACSGTISDPLGANWTNQVTGLARNVGDIGVCTGDTDSGDYDAAFWSADSFGASHYAQVTLPTSPGPNQSGPTVRAQGTGADTDYYWAMMLANEVRLYLVENGSFSQPCTSPIVGSVTWTAGDVWKLEVTGSNSLKIYKNGVQQGSTCSDATLSGGSAGMTVLENTAPGAIDAWEGGNVSAGAPACTGGLLLLGAGKC